MNVTVEGGVVFAPEMRFSAAGKAWTKVRVATHDSKPDGKGGWEDGPTMFVNVLCFGKMAENLAESVMVGDQIVVSGRLEENEWKTAEGEARKDLQIMADTLGVSLRFGSAKTERVLGDTGRGTREMDVAGESAPPF